MSRVVVSVQDMGGAAVAGALRVRVDGELIMFVHDGLPVSEQAELIASLLGPDDWIAVIPEPRAPADQPLAC